MNILVFSWRDPKHPLAGGAEQVMHEHMKGWISAGHSVTFFSSYFNGASKMENLDGVEVIRRGNQLLGVHIAAFFWYLFNNHKQFDLVVDEFHGWPFFTPLYIRIAKLAVIQELTREVWFKYPLPYGLNFCLGGIGYLIEPLFFLFYKDIHFMTGSQSAKKELQTVGIKEKNITVVPHGVLIKRPAKLAKKEAIKTVIFLGALAKDKGIEDALKAFSSLAKLNKYKFWIVGKSDEKYSKSLQQMVESLGIRKITTFFGFVSEEKKFELLARSHVMINPSIREGWGLVNIEANAMGTPVVAYTSQGLIDSVNHGVSGILVSPNTPEKLTFEIDNLLQDEEKYQKLQEGARQWSSQFTWEKSKAQSLQILERIING
jgi:glycosyltransferase involved in cell wall biosynthesis